MVFDAGSSHTSLFVYEWDSDKENDTGVVSQTLSCDVQGRYPPAMGSVLPCVFLGWVGWPGPSCCWPAHTGHLCPSGWHDEEPWLQAGWSLTPPCLYSGLESPQHRVVPTHLDWSTVALLWIFLPPPWTALGCPGCGPGWEGLTHRAGDTAESMGDVE